MLRVAVVELENIAKDIIFELGKAIKTEWSFVHLTKMSELSTAFREMPFQIVFLHEKFNVKRVNDTFVMPFQQTMFIYTMDSKLPVDFGSLFERILYIDRKAIKAEIQRVFPQIRAFLNTQEEYLISFHNLQIPIKLHDLYYVEKDEKHVIYHTKKGEFQERKTMKEVWKVLEHYNYLWIHASYIVNIEHVFKITQSIVFVKDQELPLARARKQEVLERLRGNTK